MKRLRGRKTRKKSKAVLIVIALVFFFTSILFKLYSKMANDAIINNAQIKLNEFMQGFLSNNIGYDILNKKELNNILVINTNSEGEILYVDYNLDQAYYVLDLVTKELSTLISELKKGNINTFDNNVYTNNETLAIKVPIMISTNNILIANIGPKVYIPVNFASSVLTNIKSKITNYGMNNALVELYVTIKIYTNIISPMEPVSNVIEYDVLIASMVINGRVPEAYGGLITTQSNSLTIPIN